MPKKNPAQSYDSYEVITQEDPETGDMLIPIPPSLLKQLVGVFITLSLMVRYNGS